ncbi:MAG TPA: hypothetical protein PK198_20920, partial [Saprospiraceae bacterium]|nr:hypothetical protein [Saprospiraceae bacterium]
MQLTAGFLPFTAGFCLFTSKSSENLEKGMRPLYLYRRGRPHSARKHHKIKFIYHANSKPLTMKKNFSFLRAAFTGLSLLLGTSYLFAGNTIPLGALLDGYGKIANPQNLTGEVDFSGFYPVMDECEGLIFLPPPVAPGWNALGTGLGAIVRAIAISGSDVYVGGNFTDAGGN